MALSTFDMEIPEQLCLFVFERIQQHCFHFAGLYFFVLYICCGQNSKEEQGKIRYPHKAKDK